MSPRISPGTPEARRARLAKAEQFAQAADLILERTDEDVADAYVTLCVHAGIAAADAICAAQLGHYNSSDNHNEAVSLLQSTQAGKGVHRHLSTLLNLKTPAGYSIRRMSTTHVKQAQRALDALLETARGLAR